MDDNEKTKNKIKVILTITGCIMLLLLMVHDYHTY